MREIRRTESGFTLLELLLTIGLMSLLLAGTYQLFDNWSKRTVNRLAAADMLRVQKAAEDYTLANFDTFRSDPTTFQEIDIADLRADNYLPSAYDPRNAFRQEMRVFRRNLRVPRRDATNNVVLDASGNIVYITTIEVVTVSDNPSTGTLRVPNQRLLDSAQAGGPSMGIISNIVMPGKTFTNQVSSLQSEWSFPRAALTSAGYGAVPNATGGYLAAYGLVNTEATDANDRWLYRVSIDGRPELNRMETDLNMNANEMQNVGTLVADRITVTGDAAFRGTTQGVGSETAQAMTVEQALRVDGAGESRINMKAGNAGCSFTTVGNNRTLAGGACNISGGEVQVIADTANAVMSLQTLHADGSAITDMTDIDNTTTSRGVNTFNDVEGIDLSVSRTAIAPNTTINRPGAVTSINTIQMQTGSMSVSTNSTSGSLFATRVTPGMSNSFRADNLEVANAAEFSGSLSVDHARATDTLYLNDAQGNYYDPNIDQNVSCTAHTNGRTYCEPYGVTFWNGGQFRTNCNIVGNGYECYHYRRISGVYSAYGFCRHVRTVGGAGQAVHTANCTPI